MDLSDPNSPALRSAIADRYTTYPSPPVNRMIPRVTSTSARQPAETRGSVLKDSSCARASATCPWLRTRP